jgi:hypothetical protein
VAGATGGKGVDPGGEPAVFFLGEEYELERIEGIGPSCSWKIIFLWDSTQINDARPLVIIRFSLINFFHFSV